MDNQHKSLKLKKVIKRMEDLEDYTRRLWNVPYGINLYFWRLI